ncbi:hypothetical protein LOD99_5890 [Oopsacas minuta]|uniref:WASH complex subunit 4 n=1 Tax=Oopsacas minuta TaxID=111878 RepID=A0AAV7JP21_9METZ|nr:hypothetical protein LOD99_5890 [Oopsacas minuta]
MAKRTNEKGWEVSGFDEGSHTIAIEKEQKAYLTFISDYSAQLYAMKEALSIGNLSIAGPDTTDSSMYNSPIDWNLTPHEHTNFIQLAKTENVVLTKVIVVLSVLCYEVKQLKRELYETLLPPLLLYEEEGPVHEDISDKTVKIDPTHRPEPAQGEAQVKLGRMLSIIHKLSSFVTRVNDTVKHILWQFCSLYPQSNTNRLSDTPVISINNVHLSSMWEALGDCLAMLYTLDLALSPPQGLEGASAKFREHWDQYKRLLISIQKAAPGQFPDTDHTKLKPFERLMQKWEGQLLEGEILRTCLRQDFDSPQVHVSQNYMVAEELQTSVSSLLSQIEPKIGKLGEVNHRQRLPSLYCLVALFSFVFRSKELDKKLLKQLWDTHKKLPVINILGQIVWVPDEFLKRFIADLDKVIDKKMYSAGATIRQQYLQNTPQAFSQEVADFRQKFTQWNIRISNIPNVSNVGFKNLSGFLSSHTNLILQGTLQAFNLSNTIKMLVGLHTHMKKPITKSAALNLCKAAELLQALRAQYKRRWSRLTPLLSIIYQRLQYMALSTLSTVKKRMSSDRRYTPKDLDVLASLEIMMNMFQGPSTEARRIIAKIAFHIASQVGTRIMRDDETQQLAGVVKKAEAIAEIRTWLDQATDTTFLYWYRDTLLPLYLNDLLTHPAQAPRLQYMLYALKDCLKLLANGKHLEQGALEKATEQQTYWHIRNKLLDPICNQVETDLRLSIHTHLKLDDRNPFKQRDDLIDLTHFIRLPAIEIFTRTVDMKAHLRHYLDQTFYNLNTVALHDWKTYGDMRQLARQKYGIEMTEPHLPSQTLEQGLDVLVIMRNIQVFVRDYYYNLNNQIFIQQQSDNKHLDTINIRHVSNSIRTHGIGIMNTTVNFTFQFLRKKFYIFSQFLGDEYIKGKLIKEIRFYREQKYELDQKYPHERAEKVSRSIRKLGMSEDGITYLDKFRIVITQIGNAMGYIRMIRSGGLHCTSNAIRFIPDLEDIFSFQELGQESNLPQETLDSCKQLDAVVSDLATNFAEGTDYFKLLVDVFVDEVRSQKNRHMHHFYIIIPALTLCFVDHLINAKEKMNKKNKNGAAFTDDGFAMGIAYILKLFDQYSAFDSLHWFQSVREKQGKDYDKLKENRRLSRADSKLDQTMEFTQRRIETFHKEFKLLDFSLSSARVFFRADKTAAEEAEDQKQKSGKEEQNKSEGRQSDPPTDDPSSAPPSRNAYSSDLTADQIARIPAPPPDIPI